MPPGDGAPAHSPSPAASPGRGRVLHGLTPHGRDAGGVGEGRRGAGTAGGGGGGGGVKLRDRTCNNKCRDNDIHPLTYTRSHSSIVRLNSPQNCHYSNGSRV